jgi:hypothetical protein
VFLLQQLIIAKKNKKIGLAWFGLQPNYSVRSSLKLSQPTTAATYQKR